MSREPQAPTGNGTVSDSTFRFPIPALLALIVFLFYFAPLFSGHSSIQWDAVDVHYSAQKYLSDHLHEGRIPSWTPYIFSGFPFLADPQTAAFYPLNWPIYLLGVTPRAIEWQLALHAWLACFGAWLLFRRFGLQPVSALLGACMYGLSGFFAGHSSHVGMFSAAALLPWLLWLLHRSVFGPWLASSALAGGVFGLIVLAGHAQTALYAAAAAVLFTLALAAPSPAPKGWPHLGRAIAALVLALCLGSGLAAVQVLPTLELTGESIRAGADYSGSEEGTLHLSSLTTLLLPNSLGAAAGEYSGPGDRTQYYFYAGLFLLPLAALGALRCDWQLRMAALVMLLSTFWYILGPAAGLARLLALLPIFGRLRAPIHAWFVAALALALLAAAGAQWIVEQYRWRRLLPIAAALLAFDLFYWNSLQNELAYARSSFDELYGAGLDLTRTQIVPRVAAGTRFEAPDQIARLGPMNHPLDLRFETTYGYNPLQLARYAAYRQLIEKNPKLRDTLGVSQSLDITLGGLRPNDTALPRATFPASVLVAPTPAAALQILQTLDPARETVAYASQPVDPTATVLSLKADEENIAVRYRTANPALLRLALPYFPGWHAKVGGATLPVIPLDYALMGVVLPAGENQLTLQFQSTYLAKGAAASGLSLVVLTTLVALGLRRRRAPVQESA